jgi:hypothetical protein
MTQRAVLGCHVPVPQDSLKSKVELIQWAGLAHSQEEDVAEKEGSRNRQQNLCAACCARHGVPGDGAECRGT